MSDLSYSYLKCALVTGASSGIGEEFARQLAPIAKQLVLVARREERLVALGERLLRDNPALEVFIYAVDLSKEEERDTFIRTLASKNVTPTLLVNNAGLGDRGDFASSEWGKNADILEVNMVALTHLTHAFLPAMKESGDGAIINVSSIASLLPIPDFAVYAASKAYVSSLSESLRLELKSEQIPVSQSAPDRFKTEFGDVAAREGESYDLNGSDFLAYGSERVVSDALCALFDEKPRVYPGWKVAAFAVLVSAAPLFLLRGILAKRPRQSTPGSGDA